MAVQGDVPLIESTRVYRKRQVSYVRTRPRLESPIRSEDQFRADSLPVAAKANPFRRSSPSPNRHLSPLNYQAASINGVGKARDSMAPYYDKGDDVASSERSQPWRNLKGRGNFTAISGTVKAGTAQTDLDVHLDEVCEPDCFDLALVDFSTQFERVDHEKINKKEAMSQSEYTAYICV
jgi:hypothetical protein